MQPGAMAAIKILLVDDHPLVREGIRARLEMHDSLTVLGEAGSGVEALQLAEDLKPDVVLMDISMPDMNGIDATERFQEVLPDIKVLILSMHDNREYIVNVLRSGAKGYILKDVPSHEIVTAIQAVHRGGTYFSPGVSDVLLDIDKGDLGPLTTREQTILLLLAEGMANKEVARQLDLSVRTVETHRRNIKKKLSISSTAGLTRYAIDHGLVK